MTHYQGTFGPMASAFSVCALSQNWRVIVPHGPGGNEAEGFVVKDPGWYVDDWCPDVIRRIRCDGCVLTFIAYSLGY